MAGAGEGTEPWTGRRWRSVPAGPSFNRWGSIGWWCPTLAPPKGGSAVDDNGSGNAGGNTSVYWSITHGKPEVNPRRFTTIDSRGSTLSAAGGPMGGAASLKAAGQGSDEPAPVKHPPHGHVLVNDDSIEGHTDTNFTDIGG